MNDSLGNLAVGTRQLAAVVEILDHQRGSVRRLVRDTGTVLQTVGDEQASVQELVRSGNRALSATASRDRELTATIRATPPFLRELRLSSGAVERTATLAGPTLREFRPVAPLVQPALAALRDASPQVQALLEDLEAYLPTARRALPAAAKVVRALSPLATQLGPAAAEVTPVIAYVAAYRKELVATMANVAASTNAKTPATDGRATSYLRTLIPINEESFMGHQRRLPTNRHNAYRAPGGLAPLESGLTSSGLRARPRRRVGPALPAAAPVAVRRRAGALLSAHRAGQAEMTRRAIAAAALLCLCFASTAHADEARITGERRVSERVIELTIATPAFAGPTKVHVNLPVGYDTAPSRRWPVTYVTAGTMNTYATFNNFLEGEKLARGHPAIIVSPNGDSGYWSDWYNAGAFGPPKYETYVIEQLIPLIDARFRTRADRSHRAIFGISMGGYGATMLAAHHPDLFAAAATLSGRGRQQPAAQRRRPVGQLDVRRRPGGRHLRPALDPGGALARAQPHRPRGEPA